MLLHVLIFMIKVGCINRTIELLYFSFLVDKALLETPEDEIDPQRLPIKDLILLAEHKERLAVHRTLILAAMLFEILFFFFSFVTFPFLYLLCLCFYARFKIANFLLPFPTCPLMQSKEAAALKTPLTNLRYLYF